MKKIIFLFLILNLSCGVFLINCSKSGRRTTRLNNRNSVENIISEPTVKPTPKRVPETNDGKTVLKMKKVGGVYEIPIEINEIPMNFIFDTGASLISISEKEINQLRKQGKFSESDIIGEGKFSDANGDISEGTIINLKVVKIGDRVLNNIEASVVHNLKAPLLIGQSALENFGKISIDYKKNEITFE